jgi:hypothetical protein
MAILSTMKMPMLASLLLLVLAMAFIGPAWADLDQAIEAYRQGEYEAAHDAFLPLARDGDAEAQFMLGVLYDNGRGVLRDYDEARRWYHLAARQGSAKAQYNLGTMYENGRGVRRNYGLAMNWYRLAAEQGAAKAQNNLGLMYEDGRGTPQDYVRAHMWFNLATARLPSDKDRSFAAKNRDFVAVKMTPGQVAEAQMMANVWRPKPVGSPRPETMPPIADQALDLEIFAPCGAHGSESNALLRFRILQDDAKLSTGSEKRCD